jgi:hypothetical protein
VKEQISLSLKEINIRCKNIERNTAKIVITLISYAVATKTSAQREIDATTTTIIASYNNINQQRQLKKAKREKNTNLQDKRAERKKQFAIALRQRID